MFEQQIYDDPFRHVVFRGLFPLDLYAEILEQANTVKYEKFRKYRQRHQVKPIGIWSDVLDVLLDPLWRRQLWEWCWQKPEPKEVTPKVVLMRDKPGYELQPHNDSGGKVLTSQYYLTGQVEDLGTSIYSSEKGNEVQRIPYEPNVGYCFPVFEDSWHGRVKGDAMRHSLMMIFYHKDRCVAGYD